MCEKKRKEERRKGRWRRRKTSLVIKSSWGTGYGEGKNHEVGQTLQDFQRDGLLLLMHSCWTVCQGGLIVSLSLLFKICLFKITMMSLSISQALLPFCVSFRFQDCCHCVCHSPLQATGDVYLDAGKPRRSGPPRKGWSESLVCAVEGSSSVRVTRFTHHTLLSRDSDSHLPSVQCKALRLFSTPLPKII